MTYIITVRTQESILMASDTRLNYHYNKKINGEMYQEIVAVADCIQKTFFIKKARMGIQFLGIGYFPDNNGVKYPLSHFIKKLENKNYINNFKKNAKKIFLFLQKISQKKNIGQYVKGVMCGFDEDNKSHICSFNTFNDFFEIKAISIGQFIDSENNNTDFSHTEAEALQEINKRINKVGKEKYWNIGGPIEILKITPQEIRFIQKNTKLFDGSQKELVNYFKNDISKINGYVLQKPHLEKYCF